MTDLNVQEMQRQHDAEIARLKAEIQHRQDEYDGDPLHAMHQDTVRPANFFDGLDHDEILALDAKEREQAAVNAQRKAEQQAADLAQMTELARQDEADAKLDWQKTELRKRFDNVTRMCLVSLANKRVPPSPELQALVETKLANVTHYSTDSIGAAIDELIAEGRIQPDYSEDFTKNLHAEFEGFRKRGVNLPAHYETTFDKWGDDTMHAEFRDGALREISATEVQGLVRLITRGEQAKQKAQPKPAPVTQHRPGSLAARASKVVL